MSSDPFKLVSDIRKSKKDLMNAISKAKNEMDAVEEEKMSQIKALRDQEEDLVRELNSISGHSSVLDEIEALEQQRLLFDSQISELKQRKRELEIEISKLESGSSVQPQNSSYELIKSIAPLRVVKAGSQEIKVITAFGTPESTVPITVSSLSSSSRSDIWEQLLHLRRISSRDEF